TRFSRDWSSDVCSSDLCVNNGSSGLEVRVPAKERDQMREAVICEPLRTPIGRFGGAFKNVPAVDLASTVIRALLERTSLPGSARSEERRVGKECRARWS